MNLLKRQESIMQQVSHTYVQAQIKNTLRNRQTDISHKETYDTYVCITQPA